MIVIENKKECCGCSACVQACPVNCIEFCEDEQGFRYPIVNEKLCINCHLCEKVCPCINQFDNNKPIKVFAGINRNETIRLKSSSGGIFILLAEKVIDAGGVVFGARFDEKWEVRHDYTETREGLFTFQGSKYVQSFIGDSYKQTRDFLLAGRTVLFSGTPCQISGLKHFLRGKTEGLITIDMACHGVPSPLIWRAYLKENISYITNIDFRDKSNGWRNYKLTVRNGDNKDRLSNSIIMSECFKENFFMQLFLKDLSLRPSCYNCPAKAGKSNSDIMLSDFWGVEKYHESIDDDKGTSAILVYTEKGLELLKNVNAILVDSSFENVIHSNPSIIVSTQENCYSKIFWSEFYNNGLESCGRILQMMKPFFLTRVKNRLFTFFDWILK